MVSQRDQGYSRPNDNATDSKMIQYQIDKTSRTPNCRDPAGPEQISCGTIPRKSGNFDLSVPIFGLSSLATIWALVLIESNGCKIIWATSLATPPAMTDSAKVIGGSENWSWFGSNPLLRREGRCWGGMVFTGLNLDSLTWKRRNNARIVFRMNSLNLPFPIFSPFLGKVCGELSRV